jgi:hypothetical protein
MSSKLFMTMKALMLLFEDDATSEEVLDTVYACCNVVRSPRCCFLCFEVLTQHLERRRFKTDDNISVQKFLASPKKKINSI